MKLYELIRDVIIVVTRKPDSEDFIARHWRTWVGHATVVVTMTQIGKTFDLLPFIAGTAGLFGILTIFYYLMREFGPGGNYYDKPKGPGARMEKMADSFIDFVSPLMLGGAALVLLTYLESLALTLILCGVIYEIYKREK